MYYRKEKVLLRESGGWGWILPIYKVVGRDAEIGNIFKLDNMRISGENYQKYTILQLSVHNFFVYHLF